MYGCINMVLTIIGNHGHNHFIRSIIAFSTKIIEMGI